MFRQLEPHVGFGWTIRVMAFVMLGIALVPIAGMRQRIPPTNFRQTINPTTLKDRTYLLFCIAEFFGFTSVYIVFFYIQLYALTKCNTSDDISSSLLAITNAGSLVGRLIPNYLSDMFTGPMNMQVLCTFLTAILAFAWIGVDSTAGVVVFCILYGIFSGAFVSLGGPVCFSITSDLGTMGTRVGFVTAVCGVGLLVGNPIAGAILTRNGWLGLQIWAAVLLLVSGFFQLAARVAKQGWALRVKV